MAYWVYPHDRMVRFDGFAPNEFSIAASILRLRESAVLGTEPFQQCLDRL